MSLTVKPCHNWIEEQKQIDDWIAKNKPDSVKSCTLFENFVQGYGSNIQGSSAFVDKTLKIVQKAASRASGILVLERLLAVDKEHKVTFVEEKGINGNGFERPSTLKLNFCNPQRKYHYIAINDKGERLFAKSSSVTTFIHECAHVIHYLENRAAEMERAIAPGSSWEWDSEEEEFAITGRVGSEATKPIDFCCEKYVA